MDIKRHRLGKLKRHRASPMLVRTIKQAQTIALQQVLLKEAQEDRQRLERALHAVVHSNPDWNKNLSVGDMMLTLRLVEDMK